MKEKGLRIKQCPVCKKEFLPGVEHIYKANGRMVCSWKCQRTVEKLKERKKKEKKVC